ncbi:sensor histidine kinase [Allokutzneria albata]|nr:sensor histidine kinase [Allokutzneria albata]
MTTKGTPVRAHLGAVGRRALVLVGLVPSAMITLFAGIALLISAMMIVAAGIGLVLVPLALVALRGWTDLHRVLAGRLLGREVPVRSRGLRGGVGSWWKQLLGDRATYRDLLWMPLQVVVGGALGLAAMLLLGIPVVSVAAMVLWWLPIGAELQYLPGFAMGDPLSAYGLGIPGLLLGSLLAYKLIPPMAQAWAELTARLLHESTVDALEKRVDVLTETRADALHAHNAELRRIERDLHDGTQAKLVSISLRLGIAQQVVREEPETALTLMSEAQQRTDSAMAELRTIARTIYPPILADRGLTGALHSLVADSGVPAHLELGEVGALPAAIEAAAYFVVAESLANVGKHSGASFALVSVGRIDDHLRVSITDDGRGGIEESRGSGVTGIRRRVAALDGRTTVDSPVGGPTTVTAEFPCAP